MYRPLNYLLFILILGILFQCSKKEDPRPAPKAGFTWSNSESGIIQFSDQSIEADTYIWNFGDGSPDSNEQNPKHTYANNGKYKVILTVKNPTDLSQLTKEIEVTSYASPVASFTYSVGDDGIVKFLNTSINGKIFSWDFGNGTSSKSESPSIQYTENKNYTVTLSVTGPGGDNKVSKDVEVTNKKPIADFSWSESNGSVNFLNKSKNADTYSWDFGNGYTSVDANPSVKYLKAGVYSIRLTAQNKAGQATKTTSISIATIILTMADVVDDPSLVNFLAGTWGGYVSGPGKKFDNYTYQFSRLNNTLLYKDFYSPYQYIDGTETINLTYRYQIKDKVILVDDPSGWKKLARIQPVSEDEMKLFTILETATSYSELTPYLLTKTSDTEKAINEVVKSSTLASTLKGIWDQGVYSIYTDVFFDFSAGKNFYYYNTTFQGAKSIQKVEFKVDANNIMSYRNWNSDFDPSWKKYKLELVSTGTLKLYTIDSNGKISGQPIYTLSKR